MKQVENENYSEALSQVKKSLTVPFSIKSSKLLELSNKMLNEIDQLSSLPEFAIKSLHNFIAFQSNSNHSSSYFLKQQTFLRNIVDRIQKGEQISELKFIARKLFSAEKMLSNACGDFEQMSEKEILDPWIKVASFLKSASETAFFTRFLSSQLQCV